jgi:hypothetical protein
MANVLDEYLSVWNRKPALRAIYEDFYHRIAALCTSGLTIEIGGGIGNLKPRLPIRAMARLRVLHHLEFPSRFFREAGRLLRPGGRIMVESAVSSTMSRFGRLPIRWSRELQIRAAIRMTSIKPFLP